MAKSWPFSDHNSKSFKLINKLLTSHTYLMLLQPAGTSPLWADHIFLIMMYTTGRRQALQGRPQDLGGGGPRIFFFRFGNLHVVKRHAAHGEAMRIARGVRGHAPPRKFFKTVQFGAF